MSLNKEAYVRYIVIDECIRNRQKPYPTMEELIAACGNRLSKSLAVSTIQKDIKAMKEDLSLGFEAPIRFSKSKNGYYYTDPEFSISNIALQGNEVEALKMAAELLKTISGSRVGASFEAALNKIMLHLKNEPDKSREGIPLVCMEKVPLQSGFEHFELLRNAIKAEVVISIVYYDFLLGEFSTDLVHPYQLTEFHNQWYLIGFSESQKMLRVCGLDRVFNPIEVKRNFNSSKRKDVKKYNESMYGVHPVAGQKKQKIVFAAAADTANYLKAHPLHHSQKCVGNDTHCIFIFSIELFPTDELIRWFFKNADVVQLLENDFVFTEIKKLIKKTLSHYN